MKNFSKFFFAIFCIFSIWACDQKSTTKSPVQTSRQYRDSLGTYNNDPNNPNYNGIVGNPNNSGVKGRIFSQFDSLFNAAIKGLVSSDIDPAGFGYVNPQNGVTIEGYIDIVQNRINIQTSNVLITINDSFSLSGQQPVYKISYGFAADGGFTGNNQFTVVFDDSNYGIITLNATINGNTIGGTVTYKNRKSFDNVSQARFGTLGDFQIPTCSFIRCN